MPDGRRNTLGRAIVYRPLQFQHAPLLGSIDRSERIDAIYRVRQGMLELEHTQHEIQGLGRP